MKFISLVLVSSAYLTYSASEKAAQANIKNDKAFFSRMGINPEGKRVSWRERKNLLQDKSSKKEILATAAIDEFTQALDEAHRKGIRGEGYGAIILEKEGFIPAFNKLQLRKNQFEEIDPSSSIHHRSAAFREKVYSHGTGVIHTFHQIAPQASILSMAPKDYLYNPFKETSGFPDGKEKEREETLRKALQSKKIVAVNMSYIYKDRGTTEENTKFLNIFFQDTFSSGLNQGYRNISPKLLIKGGGNSGENYTDTEYGFSKTLWPYALFVGALDPKTGGIAPYSSYPGWDRELQQNWLCTLGSVKNLYKGETLSPEDFDTYHGTSFAAPAVTGAAVLLAEYINKKHKAESTPQILKEILLHSARRSFFVTKTVVEEKQTELPMPDMYKRYPQNRKYYRPQYQTISFQYDTLDYVYEQEDPFNKSLDLKAASDNEKLSKLKFHKGKRVYDKVSSTPFDSQKHKYGMGILDLKNAFLYADIKYEHPDWKPEDIRKEMLQRNYEETQRSATTIQKWWRSKRGVPLASKEELK